MPDDPAVPPSQAPLPPAEGDGEIKAMNAVVAALKGLKDEERRRVLEYVLGRFGAVPLQTQIAPPTPAVSATLSLAPTPPAAGGIHDIRTLRETKNPRSANEMAALVAYYVSELALPAEKKLEINKTDIERYFKSGGFKLTSKAGQTLVNAKHAGYLDAGSDAGQYKLNPVGYNLVVHRLGVDGEKRKRRRTRNEKKPPRRNK
jgi:hypothetical protein